MILRRMILNSSTKGDDKGEYTVTRGVKMHGCILHIKGWRDERTSRRNQSRKNIDSNLQPEKITIKGRESEKEKQGWKKRFCRGI